LKLQVSSRYLDNYIVLLRVYVRGVPAQLIFNLDEMGLSDSDERKTKPVIVLLDTIQTARHSPPNRAIRHDTMLCCISAFADGYIEVTKVRILSLQRTGNAIPV
jgi:hypothetical protein